MSSWKNELTKIFEKKAQNINLKRNDLVCLSEGELLKSFELGKDNYSYFKKAVNFQVTNYDIEKTNKESVIHGVLGWFTLRVNGEIFLSTNITAPDTTWQQSVLFFKKPIKVCYGDFLTMEVEYFQKYWNIQTKEMRKLK